MATAPTEYIRYVTWWGGGVTVHHLLIEGNVVEASIGGRQGPRATHWVDGLCCTVSQTHVVPTAPFGWRIILYSVQTHVLTAQGKTAQTMGLVSRCPLLHLDWWSNHKAWTMKMAQNHLMRPWLHDRIILYLMFACPHHIKETRASM